MTADVASHRKPKQHPLASNTVRTAATLALAGAATATLLDGTGHAAPRLTTAQLRDRVDRFYQQAEVATERYNGAKEKAAAAETALGGLQDEAARKTQRLNAARDALGSVATAQYRDGSVPTSMRLLLSSTPGQYLDRASLADQAGSREAVAVDRFRHELRDVQQVRTTADTRLAELKRQQSSIARDKHAIEAKLNEARQLLDRMPAPARTAVEQGDITSAPAHAVAAAVPTAAQAVHTASATGRAAKAVAFAYAALGKPYVWGATGPSAFDCSGLTQAAWQAAGVSLPRTTYTQINSGRRIARGQLAPGDLVFFYSGVSHVGIYVGNGQMIHAPHPGAPVRLAPVDEMPFAGAARPA